MGSSTEASPGETGQKEDGVRRRDFIYVATTAFAGVGTVAALWPFVSQMSPSADVLALASIEVDVSAIEPGQAIKAMWQSKPVFIRNLTTKEQQEADAVALSDLRDPQTLEQITAQGKKNWLINIGICTHLGCIPLGVGEGEPRGDYGGYFCPCHGSHYDTAARVRKGPAPLNLAVPPYTFKTPTLVEIG